MLKKQASDWAKRKAKWDGEKGNGEVLEFDISDDEMKSLSGKEFSNKVTPELCKCFTTNRGGGKMHSYDYVSGPMLANPRNFKTAGVKTIGQQTSFHTPKAIDILNKSLK